MPYSHEKFIILEGLNQTVPRCQALSKRSREQCRKAALRGKDKCRMHGGASTGPVTAEGRKRCAKAKFVHGWEGRKQRELRAHKFREMKTLVSWLDGGYKKQKR